jgi:hypothetical protein
MMHGQQNIKLISDVLSFQPTKLSQFLWDVAGLD